MKSLMMERGSLMIGYQPLDDNPNFFRFEYKLYINLRALSKASPEYPA